MNEPIWISVELACMVHERQLAEHGGPSGIRDHGLLDSALSRPVQKFSYEPRANDPHTLAAAYGFGIARNHPFIDGNKRTAAVLCELFLELNGHKLVASDTELYPIFIALAAGELDEMELADWLRASSRPDRVSETQASYG